MFPFRYRSIFRSRWIALLWAAGICWTAVDVAGWGKNDDGGNAASTNQQQAALAGNDGDLSTLENQVHAIESK